MTKFIGNKDVPKWISDISEITKPDDIKKKDEQIRLENESKEITYKVKEQYELLKDEFILLKDKLSNNRININIDKLKDNKDIFIVKYCGNSLIVKFDSADNSIKYLLNDIIIKNIIWNKLSSFFAEYTNQHQKADFNTINNEIVSKLINVNNR